MPDDLHPRRGRPLRRSPRCTCSVRACAVVLWTLAHLGGCGEDPSQLTARSRLALRSDQLQEAIRLAQKALERQPSDLPALHVLVEARLRLGLLDEAGADLASLQRLAPADAEFTRLELQWCWQSLEQMRMQALHSLAVPAIPRFEAIAARAHAAAPALPPAQAATAAARADDYLAWALERNVAATRARLADKALAFNDRKGLDQTAQDLERRARELRRSQRVRLGEALAKDPARHDAVALLAERYSREASWLPLWELGLAYAARNDAEPSTVVSLSLGLLSMPDLAKPKAQRLDLIGRLQAAVPEPARQESWRWRMNEGRLALARGQWDAAIDLLKPTLSHVPPDPEARVLLAQAHFAKGQYSEVAVVLAPVRRDSRLPEPETLVALTLARQGDTAQARTLLREVTELFPDYTPAREALMTLLAEAGHIDQARQDIEAYLSHRPDDARAARVAFQFEVAAGRIDAARELLKGIELLPQPTDEHLAFLVEGCLALEEPDRAKAAAQTLVKLRPELREARLLLVEACVAQGQLAEAADAVRRAVSDLKLDADPDRLLAGVYVRRRRLPEAQALLQGVLRDHPEDHEARLLVAQAWIGAGRVEAALAEINRVLEVSPKHPGAHVLAARMYLLIGQEQAAEAHLADLDAAGPLEASDPALSAHLLLARGDVDASIATANRALIQGHSDPLLRVLLARAAQKRDDMPGEESHLLALARARPHDPQPYALLRDHYTRRRDLERGVDALETLVRFDRRLAVGAQASLLMAANKPEAAQIKLRQAFDALLKDRDPRAFELADALAAVHEALGELPRAAEPYRLLVQAGILPARSGFRLLMIESAGRSATELVSRLESLASTLTPSDASLRIEILDQLLRLNAHEASVRVLTLWREREPGSSELLPRLAEAQLRLGRAAQAIDVLKQAIAAAPRDLSLRQRLAQAHMVRHDHPAAEAALRDGLPAADPESQAVLLGALGQLYTDLGLFSLAHTTFAQAQNASPEPLADGAVLYAMGRAAFQVNQTQAARRAWLRVVRLSPRYPDAQIELTLAELRDGLEDQAAQRLTQLLAAPALASYVAERLIASAPRRSATDRSLLALADGLMPLEALEASTLDRWIELRARLAADAGQWDRADKALDRLTQLRPKDSKPAAARAILLLHLDRREAALEILRTHGTLVTSPLGPLLGAALDRVVAPVAQAAPNPDAPLNDFFRGMATGDTHLAADAARSLTPTLLFHRDDLLATAQHPDAARQTVVEAYQRLALAHAALQCDLAPLAEVLARPVAAIWQSHPVAHAVLARAILDQGKPLTDAVATAQGQIDDTSVGRVLRSRALAAEGRHDEALAPLLELLARDPANSQVRFEITLRQQAAGRIDLAIPHWLWMVENDTRYRETAANNFAYLATELDPAAYGDRAQQLIEESLRRSPDNASMLDTLGWVAYLRGRYAQALPPLRRAIEQRPTRTSVHHHLGAVYHALGQFGWARYHLEQASSGPAVDPAAMRARELLMRTP